MKPYMKYRIIPLLMVCLLYLTVWRVDFERYKPVFKQEKPALKIQYILDAGHGGEDGGAISRTGVPESHINLEIAIKLDALLGFLGVTTLMTRVEDISIHDNEADTLREKKISDLKKRVSIMEQYPDSTLISIHQNTYPKEEYRGTQIFFAPTPGSKELAYFIQQTIVSNLQPENTRQEKQIPNTVYLMNHVKNRAILVECGFLTNPEEEQLLRDTEYQKKLAIVLSSGLILQNRVE